MTAVDEGLAAPSVDVDRHPVKDPAVKVIFGLPITDAGGRRAAAKVPPKQPPETP